MSLLDRPQELGESFFRRLLEGSGRQATCEKRLVGLRVRPGANGDAGGASGVGGELDLESDLEEGVNQFSHFDNLPIFIRDCHCRMTQILRQLVSDTTMISFDAHNHLQCQQPASRHAIGPSNFHGAFSPLELAEEIAAEGMECASCATCEEDWSSLVKLGQKFPSIVIPGFGIHPWWSDTVRPGWEGRLETLLRSNPGAFVGEAGLDGYRASRPTGISLETQRLALEPQLSLARKLDRPAMLHCVKAWENLAEFLRHAGLRRFAIHRFKGSLEMAREIVDMGGHLCVHLDTLSHPPSAEAIQATSLERILVESDYDGPRPEALPVPQTIANTLTELATLLHLPVATVAAITRANALAFFRVKQA